MVSKKYLFTEAILLLALIISGIYGASAHINSGVRKSGGEITIENYGDYLRTECVRSAAEGQTYYYNVRFSCADELIIITDLNVRYKVDAEYSNFGTYAAEFDSISGFEYETVTVSAHFDLPNTPEAAPDPFPDVTILDVSGHYRYKY